jgi:hypothetical protein
LLSECHMVLQYTCKCNFIYAHKKSVAFSVAVSMKRCLSAFAGSLYSKLISAMSLLMQAQWRKHNVLGKTSITHTLQKHVSTDWLLQVSTDMAYCWCSLMQDISW